MRKNNIDYTLELPDDDQVLPVDGARLRQAFLHLIRNAIEAMPEGGHLNVRAERTEEAVRITISDTGPGISETALLRVTDPFYTTKVYGTGMGLTLVEQILSLHKGSFRLQPRPEGGMMATIILPFSLSTMAQA